MPAISIKNINKTYIDQDGNEVQALHDINLDVAEGEFVCIVGPSGCGKSTLLEIVAGLAGCYKRRSIVDGQPVHGTKEILAWYSRMPPCFPGEPYGKMWHSDWRSPEYPGKREKNG